MPFKNFLFIVLEFFAALSLHPFCQTLW
jgi:hypothetical protein